MIDGKDAIIKKIVELDTKVKNKEKLSTKEGEQLKTLHIALEMYQRGYKISNINLYKSDSVNFVVDKENKLLKTVVTVRSFQQCILLKPPKTDSTIVL